MGDNLHGRVGRMARSAYSLSLNLDADVIVFEWPGFGHTHTVDGMLLKAMCCMCCGGCSCERVQHQQGSCSASATLVREGYTGVIEYVSKPLDEGGMGVPIQNVVLYGSSMGTAFTVDVAAHLAMQGIHIGAVVLVGTIASAARTVCSRGAAACLCCLDQLNTLDRAELVRSPVLLLQVTFLCSIESFRSHKLVRYDAIRGLRTARHRWMELLL